MKLKKFLFYVKNRIPVENILEHTSGWSGRGTNILVSHNELRLLIIND